MRLYILNHFMEQKFMKILALGIVAVYLAGCASYFQPAEPANKMWKPTGQAQVDVNTALKQCNFIDRMSAGVQKIQEQAKCMRDLGFDPDFSSYNPNNCYGDAPAGCIVYWPQGIAQPQPVKAQPARPKN
jgi:hypothetical protein